MAKKLCFALGSGGSRGIAHIGFLQAMEENGIKPDCIVGCSMGSVVGACYATGITPAKMKEVAESIKTADIIDISPFFFSKKSLLRSHKMRNKITHLLGDKTFDDVNIPFSCVAVDLVSGKPVTLKEGRLDMAVSASSSIPTVFKPVEIGDMELVDGGIVMRVPVTLAEDFGADVIIAVDVLGELKPYKYERNILQQLLKVIEVNDYYHTKNYLEKHKPNLVIMPDLGDMSEFKIEKITFAYEQGYKAGIDAVKDIKKLIKN